MSTATGKAIKTYEQQMERDLLSAMAERGWYHSERGPRPVFPAPRAFRAGEIDRLSASFRTTSYTADEHLRATLRNMRARSRHLCMNDPYARRFLSLLAINVIGEQGVMLQSQVMQPAAPKVGKGPAVMVFDVLANRAIEDAWWSWGAEGVCDVTGEHSFVELQSLIVKTAARDGEALVRKLYGKKWNRYGFALQLIEADYLDEQNWQQLANGNRIIMGVEKDPWGRRVAYHFLTSHPGEQFAGYMPLDGQNGYTFNGRWYVRVPADEILHIGIADRPGQTRFAPWMFASMLRLNHIDAYDEAAIINARMGASKMGFIRTDKDLGSVATSTGSSGELQIDAEPGSFHKLPEGWGLDTFDTKYPDGEYKVFQSAMLRGVSVGIDTDYCSLSGDYDLNFASIRASKIDARDAWRMIQGWLVRKLLGPGPAKVFPAWLDTALMLGAITLPNGSALPYAKFDKFNAPKWQPRGFDWVDPKNDIDADVTAINNGLMTRGESCAKRGKDFRDVCAELAEEKRIADELGLDFSQGKTEAAFKQLFQKSTEKGQEE